MLNISRSSQLLLAAGIVTQLFSLQAFAASYYWDPLATGGAGGGSGLWDTETPIWATAGTGGTDTTWVNGSDAFFDGTAGIANTVGLNVPISVGDLSFSIAGYTITTGDIAPLTLTGGITATNSAGAAIGATNINGTGGVVLNGDQAISVTNGLNISTVLSGSNTLTKTGTGSLGLSGANTFTGKFVVNAGLLGINSDAALGAVSSAFQADSITLDGGGLAAATNFTGPVNFANPGAITLDASRGIMLGANGGTFRVGFGTGILTVNGVISGAGALNKIDSGTLILNADNTYLGATNITGILQVGTGGTTGTLSAGKITFGTGNGNFLNFNRSDSFALANDIATGQRANIGAAVGEVITLNGAFSGTGEFWKQGLGTVVVNANPNSSRTSNNVIVNGTLQVSDLTGTATSALGTGNIYIGQAATLGTGAGLSYTGDSVSTDAFQNVQTPYGFLEVTNPDTILTFTNTFKGNNGDCLMTKLGAGTWSLAGSTDNTRGRVQVEAGTLLLAKTSSGGTHALGGANTLILNAGTVRITGSGGDQIYDPSSVQVNGGTFDLNGQNEAFDLLNSNGLGGVVTNELGGTTSTLTLGTNNGSSLYTGKLQDGAGALSLVKNGSGSLALTGTNFVSGGTFLSNGRLIVSGSLTGSATQVTGDIPNGIRSLLGGTGTTGDIVVSGGTVSPGATTFGAGIGTLSSGSLNFSNLGIFEAAIDTGARISSLADIHGDLSLGIFGATLSLIEVGIDTAVAENTTFTLMSYTGLWDGGLFSFESLGPIQDNGSFTFGSNTYELAYDAVGGTPGVKYVVLTVVPEPAAGGMVLGGLTLLGGWRRRKADRPK